MRYPNSDIEVLHKIINYIASNSLSSRLEYDTVFLSPPIIPESLLSALTVSDYRDFIREYEFACKHYLSCEGDFLSKYTRMQATAYIHAQLQQELQDIADNRKMRNENQLWQIVADRLGLKSALFYPLEPKYVFDNQIKN